MTPSRRLFSAAVALAAFVSAFAGAGAAQTSSPSPPEWVTGVYRRGDFKLAHGGGTADIVVAPEDFKVVRIAAGELAADVERVTGRRPALRASAAGATTHAVIVGTLGKSPLVEGLARAGKLDVKELRGKWESFLITTIADPSPGVSMGLVVVGSDRRGTAFGVYELAQGSRSSPRPRLRSSLRASRRKRPRSNTGCTSSRRGASASPVTSCRRSRCGPARGCVTR